jgi:hypothetical protein
MRQPLGYSRITNPLAKPSRPMLSVSKSSIRGAVKHPLLIIGLTVFAVAAGVGLGWFM